MELLTIILQSEIPVNVDEAAKGWELIKNIIGLSPKEVTIIGVLIAIIFQQYFTIRNRNSTIQTLNTDVKNCFELRNEETKENLSKVHLALVENKSLSNYVMETLGKVSEIITGCQAVKK